MLVRLFRTAAHYRPGQIAARLRLQLQGRILRLAPALAARRYAVPKRIEIASLQFFLAANFDDAANLLAEELHFLGCKRDQIEQGRFVLLNLERLLGWPMNWRPDGASRLWNYNLHYFDYAFGLAVLSAWRADRKAEELFQRLCDDWIGANPVASVPGWQSYPLARRIVNWIQSAALLRRDAGCWQSEFQSRFLASLYQQARFLEDHLEYDCLGNHLLTDAKALLFAGLFLEGGTAERFFVKGNRLFWRSLNEQVLSDGGHYERSPMYHALVLQDCLEVLLALRLNGRDVSKPACDRVLRMADFLAGLRHPDGEIPLFGDSVFGVAHPPGAILAAAGHLLDVGERWPSVSPGLYTALLTGKWKPRHVAAPQDAPAWAWPATGYIVLPGPQPGDRMIVDAKPLGPANVPAHGHCSLFSYELSVGGRRLIVDSGVEGYQAGRWRDYWRSTRAHNTVTVDGAEQSEIWSAFRVGRRCRVLQSDHLNQDGCFLFAGSHNAYRRLPGSLSHHRLLAASRHGAWLVLDQFSGAGVHLVESFIHLHPAATCELASGQAGIRMEDVNVTIAPCASKAASCLSLDCIGDQEELLQGWYASRFGDRQPNLVIRFAQRAFLPFTLGYLIAPAAWRVRGWNCAVEVDAAGRVEVVLAIQANAGEVGHRFQLLGSQNTLIPANLSWQSTLRGVEPPLT